MSNNIVHRETRAHTVIRYTEQYLRQTSVSMPTMADNIREQYFAMVPEHLREIKFHTEGDAYKMMRANAQIISRFMDGEHRLPAELEEAWVQSFPKQWRNNLIAELAARYGLLAVRRPDVVQSHTGCLAALLKETGQGIEAVSILLENGRFGPEDLPHYEKAQSELDDIIVAAMELKNKIFTEVTANCDEKKATLHTQH